MWILRFHWIPNPIVYDATIQKFIRQGKRHPPTGSDYFIDPRRMIQEMPPFAVGRPAWDNWLIQHVRSC